ncbi:AAA-domain-containing protein [Lophiostoma macrostomum CBS 122681]|uniref:AAA-domain-containing protein n=1 Tax=Lophiostoma macrostomum CBS 122681 TaxID=1314788 RepID=A0A6A6SLM8_9PLEO|nr:AAA-domain-containing protein [Lophiostoma macrostomum CBS 122681]
MSKDSAYGILKRGRIAGALLYGPPGTGKTQLARIISCECNAALISVSGAELNRKYVGETEKFVKALFKLGQMLYPSIVFIDEADSIFPSRDRITLEYDRSRINQLLTEMDGFVQSSNAPFTLLATNFPQHLDHAVLRRVPSLLHLGLPLLETRKRIFDLYLCQEILHDDVDTWILARKTHGYSGSDIKNLCVQAALGCRTFVTREGKRMRHLRDEHFHDALRRCSSTVSRTSLAEIHDLAIEHDPHSLVATVEDEVDKGGIFERALRAPALQDMDLD